MKNSIIIFLVIVSSLMITSCNQNQIHAQSSENIDAPDITSNQNEAYQLLKNKCLICHNAGSSHETMIAPPMIRVKEHYLDDELSRSTFINNIKTWVKNPSEDKIQMPGAVDKFKIMPKLAYPDHELEAIAAYIYDNELEGPSWWGNTDDDTEEVNKGIKNGNHGMDEMGHGWKKRIKLDEGEKWAANIETLDGIEKMKQIVSKSLALDILNQKTVKNNMVDVKNSILEACSMTGASHDNLHIYLVSLGEKIDKLEMIKDERMARKILKKIDKQLIEFGNYFK